MLRILVVSLAAAMLASSAGALADAHPKGFSSHRFNGSAKPVTKAGITTFQVFDRKCSTVDYGDGRGESDCYNGNVRSTLVRSPDARLNESLDYRFDIWIDPSFAYPGFFNDHSIPFLQGGIDSRLRIASWEGTFLHNFLYMLKADGTNGLTFLGKQCQAGKEFGTWVTFSMKIRWTADKTGWISVACNDKVIYAEKSTATNQAPHCYITNQCEAGIRKNPKRFIFILGPVMAGFGHEWKKYSKPSPFTEIQPEGITVRMRNISVKKVQRP
jgi:hypothetical protein